jgi:hypothetical protein
MFLLLSPDCLGLPYIVALRANSIPRCFIVQLVFFKNLQTQRHDFPETCQITRPPNVETHGLADSDQRGMTPVPCEPGIGSLHYTECAIALSWRLEQHEQIDKLGELLRKELFFFGEPKPDFSHARLYY